MTARPSTADRQTNTTPVRSSAGPMAEVPSEATQAEPIGERLRTLARLSGWPVMLVIGNLLSDVPVQTLPFNLLLAVSFVWVVVTHLLRPLHLDYFGVNLVPLLTDAVVLFGLCLFSGGVESPVRNAYLLFIIVNAIGLPVRLALLVATLYSGSYALLEVVDENGIQLSAVEEELIGRQVMYLFWTAITAGLLAQILRGATNRAQLAAQENALLFERADRAGNDLRSVLDSTFNGIVMVGTDCRVRFVSRQMGRLLGVDLSDTVGRDVMGVVRSRLKQRVKDPEAFEARLIELYDDMESEAVDEIELASPDPRLLSRYSGPVRDDTGRLLGRIEVYADITEERAADRLKDEFLSLAAHELKTPITSLKAYAQLLRRRPVAEMSPRVVETALTTIDRQASQLTLLVNDLLDVSRIETGHLELRMEDVDLTEIVGRAVEQIAATDPDDRVRMLPAESLPVRADPARIEQVAVNLLTNALKYSPGGGPVTVSVERSGNEAVTGVTDRGIGIPAEKLPYVFDRFYQAHATKQYSHGGMGIGLFICKEIVSRHGGRMWVESEEGKGSTFYFSLPLTTDEHVG